MSTELTPAEARERRAEIARRNGRLSRGPATEPGKYRSSLNGVSSGCHLDGRSADLPAFTATLAVAERKAYVRILQHALRRYTPATYDELEQVRALAAARYQAHATHGARTEAQRLAARLNRMLARRARAATSTPPKSEIARAAGR